LTDRGATRTQLTAAVLAAAEVLSSAFQLGDETRPASAWPVGDGDAVIVLTLTGDADGTLVLAVSDDVAARLTAASDVLNGGLTAAVAAVSAATGLTLNADVVSSGPVATPPYIVDILDAGRLTALAGLILAEAVEDAPEADDGADGQAEQFQPVAFDANRAAPLPAAYAPMALLHDVELVVTAELGRTTMPVRELLGLTPGMVVEINRAAGAPIDLLVNGKLIAAGEVVVIDEEFGIRITEIAPVSERT
jgi:flagellar motor switch protein FliN